MTEKKTDAPTSAEEIKDTTPEKNEQEITVPIKFNKEIKELSLSEATALAQKGMKYDLIAGDYQELKNLAAENGKSVPQYLCDLKTQKFNQRKTELTEICGGDSQLAEHFAVLESQKQPDSGFKELKEMFPEISEETIPYTVTENVKLKGTLLLDEYLRYLLAEERKQKHSAEQQKKAEKLSLGSQQNYQSSNSPETVEFLRGLWKK